LGYGLWWAHGTIFGGGPDPPQGKGQFFGGPSKHHDVEPTSSCLLGCVVESPQLVPGYSTLSDYLTSGRWGCIRDSGDSSVLVPLPVAPVQFRKRSTAWSLEGGVALDTLEILQCFRCPQSPRLPSFQFRERKTSCPLPSVVPSSTASGPRAAGPSAAFFVYCGDCARLSYLSHSIRSDDYSIYSLPVVDDFMSRNGTPRYFPPHI